MGSTFAGKMFIVAKVENISVKNQWVVNFSIHRRAFGTVPAN
jgi:hypothetical protein